MANSVQSFFQSILDSGRVNTMELRRRFSRSTKKAIFTKIVIAYFIGTIAAVGAASLSFPDGGINTEAEDTLVLAQVMFRHGNRTPDAPTFPTDPYRNYSYYPEGWGMLTKGGKVREYQNGQFLRQRYGRFLGDILDSEVMLVKSTDTPRTKNSAALVSAGLWPPAGSDKWGNGLGAMWQPVSIEVIPKKEDNLLYVWDAPCPAYDKEFNRVLHSPKVQALLDQFSDLRSYLQNHTGMTVNTPELGYQIYQAILAQKELELKVPAWVDAVFPHKMDPFVVWFFGLDAYNEKLQKLRAGVLLGEITSNFIAAAQRTLKPRGRKLFLYSAHDNNLSALMLALGVYNYLIPPYGSMILMELHRIPNAVRSQAVPDSIKVLDNATSQPLTNTPVLDPLHQYGVKFFLKNSTSHDPYPLTVPNCEQLCPLDRFILLTSHMVPKDWYAECKVESA